MLFDLLDPVLIFLSVRSIFGFCGRVERRFRCSLGERADCRLGWWLALLFFSYSRFRGRECCFDLLDPFFFFLCRFVRFSVLWRRKAVSMLTLGESRL